MSTNSSTKDSVSSTLFKSSLLFITTTPLPSYPPFEAFWTHGKPNFSKKDAFK